MKFTISRLFAATILTTGAMMLLPSCGATAAQTETPVVPLAVQKTGTLPRALWVWDATVITNSKQQSDLFDFCALKGISVVYLSVGDIFSPTQRETTDPKHVTAPMLGKFLESAHAKKLQVEALDGDPSFALEAKHADALKRLQKALDYNKVASANEKLDGFQWDTEPYILPEFKAGGASQIQVLTQYLESASQMRDAVQASPSLRLGYAIPAFFDDEARSLEWKGKKKPVAFHLMDMLNTLPSGYVAIMAYRDKALGTNGTVDISSAEVKYASENAPKVKIWIGQETLDVKGDPPSITFWQEGETALETALGQIQTAYKDKRVVAGLAIHHWGSYRILKAGDSVVSVAAGTTITEPLTIISPQTNEAVERRVEVTGTAKPGGEGVKVALAVRPAGDIWYDQGEMPLSPDGSWSLPCRMGNENTPAGRVFEIRARVLKVDASVLAEQIIKVKTK